MKIRTVHEQDGQTLIQVALFMVVLLAFLALAIDVGHIYAERRRMQNAADAGALAGAWEICFGDPSQAEATARDYTIARNGAQAADVDVQTWTVTVVASETTDTFFAGIIGIPTADVGAVAEAACGAARSAGGLWPIALEWGRWNKLWEAGCNTPFFLWNGDNPHQQPDCSLCQCDVNDDGINDIVGIEGRTWVDFTNDENLADQYDDNCAASGGCGTSELVCWIVNDSKVVIHIDDCIAGDNGVRAGTKDDIDSRIGDQVSIPLFDSTGCPSDGYCPGGQTYSIATFGCVTVGDKGVGWIQQFELPFKFPDPEDPTKTCWKGKVIQVSISCGGCDSFSGSALPGEPPPWAVKAVSLIR